MTIMSPKRWRSPVLLLVENLFRCWALGLLTTTGRWTSQWPCWLFCWIVWAKLSSDTSEHPSYTSFRTKQRQALLHNQNVWITDMLPRGPSEPLWHALPLCRPPGTHLPILPFHLSFFRFCCLIEGRNCFSFCPPSFFPRDPVDLDWQQISKGKAAKFINVSSTHPVGETTMKRNSVGWLECGLKWHLNRRTVSL